MEETNIILERHAQKLSVLERDVSDLKAVRSEMRIMNETLVSLAAELKHTNEHLSRHEKKLTEIEQQPKVRMNHILAAITSAIAGGLATALIGLLLK